MKPSKPTIKPYTHRSESYKAEALKLADRIGYTEAARQLGLHECNSTAGELNNRINKRLAAGNKNKRQKSRNSNGNC